MSYTLGVMDRENEWLPGAFKYRDTGAVRLKACSCRYATSANAGDREGDGGSSVINDHS